MNRLFMSSKAKKIHVLILKHCCILGKMLLYIYINFTRFNTYLLHFESFVTQKKNRIINTV